MATLRTGRRATGPAGSRPLLVVSLVVPGPVRGHATGAPTRPRAGFVVSRAVGNAVSRNRVRRRLRHLAAGELAGLPARATVVVRALPGAADASYADLRRAWQDAVQRAGRPPSPGRAPAPGAAG